MVEGRLMTFFGTRVNLASQDCPKYHKLKRSWAGASLLVIIPQWPYYLSFSLYAMDYWDCLLPI